MIEKIEIKNYRCFESLKLNGLKRMNVIVGPNSAGKTAFMEAIFLAAGASPELVFRTKAYRGLDTLAITLNRSSYEALWRDLFNGFDQAKTIEISLIGSPAFSRDLKIYYQRDKTMMLGLGGKDLLQDSVTPIVPIVFEWNLLSGKSISAEPQMNANGIVVKFSEPLEALPLAFYTSATQTTQQENAGYFSALSVQNKEKEIIEALKSEFPFITGLSVEIWGGMPTLFTSVEGVNDKIPLNLVSAGVNKLIGILLGIANQAGGVICIDELENGFYFDRLPSIWNLLLEFAIKYDVQIFASTHSWECLQAASDCASNSGNESEFTLIQSLTDTAGFRVHSGEALVEAMTQQIDVR